MSGMQPRAPLSRSRTVRVGLAVQLSLSRGRGCRSVSPGGWGREQAAQGKQRANRRECVKENIAPRSSPTFGAVKVFVSFLNYSGDGRAFIAYC